MVMFVLVRNSRSGGRHFKPAKDCRFIKPIKPEAMDFDMWLKYGYGVKKHYFPIPKRNHEIVFFSIWG